jgi:hypothetical protein
VNNRGVALWRDKVISHTLERPPARDWLRQSRARRLVNRVAAL